LQLNEYSDEPLPPIKFSEINKQSIDAALQSASGLIKTNNQGHYPDL